MSRLERRLLLAILVRAGALTTVACWLVFAASLSRAAGVSDDALGLEAITAAMGRALSTLDLAAAVCAPIGTLLAVRWVRRLGVLGVAMAAGLRPFRLARVLTIAAALTMLFVAAVQTLTHAPESTSDPTDIRESDGAFAWSPHAASAATILFRADTLDVSVAGMVTAPPGMQTVVPLVGSPLPLIEADHQGGTDRPLRAPPLVHAIVAGRPLGTILAAGSRLALAGCLVLLAGLLALAVPERRFWLAYGALVALFAVSALGFATLSVQLWLGGPAGFAAQAVCLALAGGLAAALFARLRQTGLRI